MLDLCFKDLFSNQKSSNSHRLCDYMIIILNLINNAVIENAITMYYIVQHSSIFANFNLSIKYWFNILIFGIFNSDRNQCNQCNASLDQLQLYGYVITVVMVSCSIALRYNRMSKNDIELTNHGQVLGM